MKKTVSFFTIFFVLFSSFIFAPAALADDEEIQEEIEEVLTLTDEDINEITDEELTEPEPSELPKREPNALLVRELEGLMLLDVEGNGEVYYVDPETGAKEYLADGAAAHSLLERRALGINEENFAQLVQGTERNEESVCETNELGERLKGRIVLRVEVAGEAWWILPSNCRAYYVGTQEAAYNLMREFSLGITKENLAQIPDTARQRLKRAVRLSVFAYAEENGVDLETARTELREELSEVRTCVRDRNVGVGEDADSGFVRAHIRSCWQDSSLPEIDQERVAEIREDIQEARQARVESRAELREIRIERRQGATRR